MAVRFGAKGRVGFVRMKHLPFFMAVAELAFDTNITAMNEVRPNNLLLRLCSNA